MDSTTTFQLANNTTLSLGPKFILPEDKRPQLSQVSALSSVLVIDMNQEPSLLLQKVSQACEEYGFFQIINHGVPLHLCERMIAKLTEFFELPCEERAQFFAADKTKQVKLFNYYLNSTDGQEKVKMWGESFSHPWHSLDDINRLVPQNPPQFWEVFAEYAKEIHVLMKGVLSLISEGLGLEKDCLEKRLGQYPGLTSQANYYPPCPDPELTLGLQPHTDVRAITILLQPQGVTGLQVIKDGKWVAINPVPNAFIVNIADQIQVLSNGRYKSVHHRVVTNKTHHRLSLAMLYRPNIEAVIGPMEDLIDEKHPPLYRDFPFSEFLEEFQRQEGKRRRVKEAFELR